MTDTLATMQRAMADALRGAAPFDEAGIASGNDRLTPAQQLDIYREQFLLRHVDVLRDDYLALERLLGAESFEALAKAYLQAFPPRSFTLRDLGCALVRFVADTRPWSDDELLADVAQVEWAFVEAFDAPDAPVLELASVTSVPEDAWPSAHIVLQPSLQRLALRHPAHEYRNAVRERAIGAPAAAIARPEARSCHVLVFRGPSRLQCREVDAVAYALLDELSRGATLGDACERVAVTASSNVEENLAAWFQEWTALGLLSRVVR
jgi:hypothetical protein